MTANSRAYWLLLLLIPAFASAGPIVEQAAIQAAEEFLELLDDGQYEQSWRESALLFQALKTEREWVEKAGRQRPLFGPTLQRTLKSAEYRSSMVGLPDGDYAVIVFETRFERKREGLETTTLIFDDDEGSWRVTGCFIR